jgi:hypothetical protein
VRRKFWQWMAGGLIATTLLGCSYAYDQGRKLEAEERWEEASVEYQRAVVSDPQNVEYREALQRVNQQVAQDNFQRYQRYLSDGEFRKAYARLQALRQQAPDWEEAATEELKWSRVLLSGQVRFEFEQLQSSIRLADEMQLQVLLNSPNGQTITAPISSENGLFFVEDLLYRQQPQAVASYSIQSIGLLLVRSTETGLQRREYQRFIDFREIQPLRVRGRLELSDAETPLLPIPVDVDADLAETSTTAWTPPRLIQYELELRGEEIVVTGTERRREFAADTFYWNAAERRALLDFGAYELQYDPEMRRWSVRRQKDVAGEAGHLRKLASNLALNPYFFYSGRAYSFVSPPE